MRFLIMGKEIKFTAAMFFGLLMFLLGNYTDPIGWSWAIFTLCAIGGVIAFFMSLE